MSWLFSRALVEEFSAGICSAGEPSAPSNGSHTQQAFLSHGKTTGFSRLSPFGMTCRPLTDSLGEAVLTSYLAAFPARTLALRGGGQALMENEAVCGGKWPESSVRYDPSSCLWKTAHCLWDEDLPWSSVTLPRWGMTRSGSVFQHPTAVRPISGTASGFWPTPTATDWKGSPSLRVVNQRSEGSSRGVRLPEHLSKLDQVEVGGNLNPTWSEWLMGWPPGWTDLGPLAMDKFLVWRRQHSACSDRDGGIKEAA